jgi:ankyrin repeat protein
MPEKPPPYVELIDKYIQPQELSTNKNGLPTYKFDVQEDQESAQGKAESLNNNYAIDSKEKIFRVDTVIDYYLGSTHTIVAHKSDVDAHNNYVLSKSVIEAAKAGDVNHIQTCLSKANIPLSEITTPNGSNAAHVMASNGHVEAFQTLITQHPALATQTTNNGKTVEESVRGNPLLTDADRDAMLTSLRAAAAEHMQNLYAQGKASEVVEILERQPTLVHAKDSKYNKSIGEYAKNSPHTNELADAIRNADSKISNNVAVSVDKKNEANPPYDSNDPAFIKRLETAALLGNTDVLKSILEANEKLQFHKDATNHNLLQLAVSNGHYDTAKMLLQLNSRIATEPDQFGSNAAHRIAMNLRTQEDIDLLKLVVEYNPSVLASVNNQKKSVLDYIKESQLADLDKQTLVAKYERQTKAYQEGALAQKQQEETNTAADNLHEKRHAKGERDFKRVHPDGSVSYETLPYYASQEKNAFLDAVIKGDNKTAMEIFKRNLDPLNGDPSFFDADVNGRHLGHEVAKIGNLDILKEMLATSAGAQFLAADKSGNKNILHEASEYGHTAMAMMLADNYEQLRDGKDTMGRKAAHWAAMNGHTATAEKLTDTFPQFLDPANDGKTPAHYVASLATTQFQKDTNGDQKTVQIDGTKTARTLIDKHPELVDKYLYAAIEGRDWETLSKAQEKNALLNSIVSAERKNLATAIANSDVEKAKEIISRCVVNDKAVLHLKGEGYESARQMVNTSENMDPAKKVELLEWIRVDRSANFGGEIPKSTRNHQAIPSNPRTNMQDDEHKEQAPKQNSKNEPELVNSPSDQNTKPAPPAVSAVSPSAPATTQVPTAAGVAAAIGVVADAAFAPFAQLGLKPTDEMKATLAAISNTFMRAGGQLTGAGDNTLLAQGNGIEAHHKQGQQSSYFTPG